MKCWNLRCSNDELAPNAVYCPECKTDRPKGDPKKEPSERSLEAAAARERFIAHAPSSADLTAQQWYNVCKFFPFVARKASAYSHRPLAAVGPANPLDKTAQMGPLFQRTEFGRRITQLREPGEDDE